MRKIAIFNQKGGVGKTTTAVNLGAGLSRNGRKVIIIDLDPQGDISGCHTVSAQKNIYHVLKGEAEIEQAITHLGKNLDIMHAENSLAALEIELTESKQFIDVLERHFTPKLDYDYVLLDCPPSLRPINLAALFYAKEVIIPAATDILGHRALTKTVEGLVEFNKKYSRNIAVSCVVPTLYESRRKVCQMMLKNMREDYTPLLVSEPIRRNSKLNEAPKAKKSIFTFAKSSPGAEDYWKLVKLTLENENMFDTKFTAQQREKAMYEYYIQGKKRELMIVDNKLTFGYKFLTAQPEIDKGHIIHKIVPFNFTDVSDKIKHKAKEAST